HHLYLPSFPTRRSSDLVLLAASMLWYVQNLLIPYQRADAAAHGRPRGNLSDLYPRWLGAREFLLHHRNPYSPEVTREIETGYYGDRKSTRLNSSHLGIS